MISVGATGALPSTTVGATVPFTESIASVSKNVRPRDSSAMVPTATPSVSGRAASASASGRKLGANSSPTWISQFQP